MNGKQIVITGGTGSFGKAFVRYLFEHYADIKKIVIFSRDEQKQHQMASEFSPKAYPIKYRLGEIWPYRLKRADRYRTSIPHLSATWRGDLMDEK